MLSLINDHFTNARDYLWVQLAGRFSIKAAIPSFWSSSENIEWKILLSNLSPSASDSSYAEFTVSLAIATAGREKDAILLAISSADFRSCSTSTKPIT
jgi:hypothetical protein